MPKSNRDLVSSPKRNGNPYRPTKPVGSTEDGWKRQLDEAQLSHLPTTALSVRSPQHPQPIWHCIWWDVPIAAGRKPWRMANPCIPSACCPQAQLLLQKPLVDPLKQKLPASRLKIYHGLRSVICIVPLQDR